MGYQEKPLFKTNGHSVLHITNDGDGSEPEKLCGNSLVRIVEPLGGQTRRSIVLTGEELDDLCKQWTELRK